MGMGQTSSRSRLNFTGVSSKSLAGKLLRLPLHLVPGSLTVRILQGALRGKRWIVGSSIHGCWLGSYEFDKQNQLTQLLTPGAVFFDVGAHVGFYTLLAASRVGSEGRVFAFEPFPRNTAFLEKHLRLNHVENATLFKAAVADTPGSAHFQEGEASSMGHIADTGTITVEQVSLDSLYEAGRLPLPDFIKIDVEGAELRVLEGARRILTEGQPTLFLATHGAAVHRNCLSLLDSLGYDCSALEEDRGLAACDEVLAVKRQKA